MPERYTAALALANPSGLVSLLSVALLVLLWRTRLGVGLHAIGNNEGAAAASLTVTSSLGQDGRAAYALALTLGMGLGGGALSGLGIALFGVPAVVMTLAMNGTMQGLTLDLSGGMTRGSCAAYAPPVVHASLPAALWP